MLCPCNRFGNVWIYTIYSLRDLLFLNYTYAFCKRDRYDSPQGRSFHYGCNCAFCIPTWITIISQSIHIRHARDFISFFSSDNYWEFLTVLSFIFSPAEFTPTTKIFGQIKLTNGIYTRKSRGFDAFYISLRSIACLLMVFAYFLSLFGFVCVL